MAPAGHGSNRASPVGGQSAFAVGRVQRAAAVPRSYLVMHASRRRARSMPVPDATLSDAMEPRWRTPQAMDTRYFPRLSYWIGRKGGPARIRESIQCKRMTFRP